MLVSTSLSRSTERKSVLPNGSPATGTGFINIDTMANQLHYNITFSGLWLGRDDGSDPLGFRPCSVNAGIIHTLPLGAAPKIGVFNYSQAQEADILNAVSPYVNIHSVNFPNGEDPGPDRPGSATPCPSPSSAPTMNKPSRWKLSWEQTRGGRPRVVAGIRRIFLSQVGRGLGSAIDVPSSRLPSEGRASARPSLSRLTPNALKARPLLHPRYGDIRIFFPLQARFRRLRRNMELIVAS